MDAALLGMTMKAAKRNFLDRRHVIAEIGKANARRLARIGAYTRKAAMRSIKNARAKKLSDMTPADRELLREARRAARAQGRPAPRWRPRAASKPGQPPASWTGELRENIVFSMVKDGDRPTVLVGPIGFGRRGEDPVPKILEYGGRSTDRRSQTSHYVAPRPYMRPARQKAIDRLPELFR